ncbi:MAG TPA: hypothetical protein VI612_02175 [Candidatus Nanoarchaeia archaeon]|nr:hypothetical protein [Candidatus Nanoarchaeia archaeon]
MDVGYIINKIMNEEDPRDLFEVPVALGLDDVPIDALPSAAQKAGVVNQLGALVDLTLECIIPLSHPRYAVLRALSATLYPDREPGVQPFYGQEHPDLVRVVERRMETLNDPRVYRILKKWGLTGVIDPIKSKQVYEQEYEDRQAATSRHS